ncbi:enoyl-CoA hydratase [Acrocarpospora pleiomorpha]|uniref:Enoyl-CoA hydratase n=1 Tax=Acrocarpospora pleiomorpha TaxID=90975 RepID=A0A5M3XFL2_9ACTN|nr:enoyl-CoA hydratase/isomerase family protein [Acrocarpospora pleiomorpha]GES20054.1 enoyl-CoA hydratase [Acrocarpospora pleiomorpha]
MSAVLRSEALEGGVVVLEMARPERLNAISRRLARDLTDALVLLAGDATTRAVVLTGAGERAFGAGIDVRELAEQTPAERDEQQELMIGLQRALSDYALPTIAAVHGIAAGASLQLALHCDLLVVGPGARLGLPELSAGLPGILGAWLVHSRVGPQLAADLLLTSRWLSADEAVAAGLAARLVPAGEERATAVAIARGIASLEPAALAATHAWLRRLRTAPVTFADAVEAADEALHAANHPDGSDG